jgi:uncharacterized LabA/DUF88 family protein
MKTAIFIDGGYLSKIGKYFGEPTVDIAKLSIELARGQEILRTYYYDCLPYQSNPPTPEESLRLSSKQRFFHRLNSLPKCQVREGKLQFKGLDNTGRTIFVQKGVDVRLSVDMLSLAAQRAISEAVLLAGDGDLLHAVIGVKELGVNTTLFHYGSPSSYSHDLWLECDERFPITQELIDKVTIARPTYPAHKATT